MKYAIALVVAILVSLPGIAAVAQPFAVVSSQPADGATEVETQTTVRFVFSREVEVTTEWDRAFVVVPRDSVRLLSVSLLLDDEGRPAVVEWEVEHTADTDFTWLVHAVGSADGADMAEPYVFRYTTAPDLGSYTVSGTVGAMVAKRGASTPEERDVLTAVTNTLKQRGLGTPLFEAPSAPAGNPVARMSLRAQEAEAHTHVFLLSGPAIEDARSTVAAATVLPDVTGTFTMDYVRDGTYWPLAVKYADRGSTLIEAVGYYDSDGDGAVDPVVVAGGSVTGVDLQLVTFPRVTASAYYSEAWDVAMGTDPDQRLVLIEGDYGLGLDGRAYTWRYSFYSPGENRVIVVEVNPVQSRERTDEPSRLLRDAAGIGRTFVDSEAAVDAALEDGGEAFITSVGSENVVPILQAGNLHWYFDAPTRETYWRVRFIDQAGNRDFVRFVNMTTGAVRTHSEFPGASSWTTALASPYPNPFATTTRIPFTLEQPESAVTLEIYDLLGRRVAQLLGGAALPAGSHEFMWAPGGLGSGSYYVRLKTPASTQSRVVHLVR